ncbi:hypothetical protein ACWF9B_13340 [Streptomyces sp. NPDC055089]
MVAVDLLPLHDRVNPEAALVRQPREEAPFDYGWGATWHPEDDPELVARAQQWEDGPWRWTLFVRGAPLPAEGTEAHPGHHRVATRLGAPTGRGGGDDEAPRPAEAGRGAK